ncbi:MAG: hypothetical protein JRE14_01085, partial [Deltaproteobacteria bacterium]|nr:hypothetical protein [Deltaproteobacteria bacterium]
YSHPQALAQCREFLMRNHLEPRPYYDTAGAAKMLARENLNAAVAIASELSAELYNLEIIKRGIEDSPANSTRFLLLSRDAYEKVGDKTSIIFVTPHKAGSLYGILQLFAESGINLTRIASMPLRTEPDNYSFFLDFEGTEKDLAVSDVLQKMEELTVTMKYLGSYPAANGPTVCFRKTSGIKNNGTKPRTASRPTGPKSCMAVLPKRGPTTMPRV